MPVKTYTDYPPTGSYRSVPIPPPPPPKKYTPLNVNLSVTSTAAPRHTPLLKFVNYLIYTHKDTITEESLIEAYRKFNKKD